MSIRLYSQVSCGPYEEFGDSKENLLSETCFKRAVVTTGTWIFYTNANYNKSQPGANATNIKILKPGDDENISCVNGSMYLLRDAVEGIVLFEHAYYGGTRKWYDESSSDLTGLFAPHKVAGVSSAIVLSQNQNFAVYSKPKYQGLQNELKAGKWYDTPAAMKFPNDSVQSLRKM